MKVLFIALMLSFSANAAMTAKEIKQTANDEMAKIQNDTAAICKLIPVTSGDISKCDKLVRKSIRTSFDLGRIHAKAEAKENKQ